jgi:acetylornithine deacetylase/succinyl-diaminopimelate desuccinylase-like protein
MKLTKKQLKRIIKEELEALSSSGAALLREEEPERPWVMPKGYEKEPYTSNIDEVYAFLDKSYEKNQGKESYPTLMGYNLESFVKENLGPNWVRWMVANYFNDKLERERTPEEVSKTYTEYIMKM